MIFEGKVGEVYKVSASPTPSEKLFLIVLHFLSILGMARILLVSDPHPQKRR